MADFYLSDPTGKAFGGAPADTMGDYCCISHDCPKCGELASKGRTLAWLASECGKKGGAKFPCPKCGAFLNFPKEVFRPVAMEELQRHFQPNALLRAMSAEEVFQPHWPALLLRANGVDAADDAVQGNAVRATVTLGEEEAPAEAPAAAAPVSSPLDEILALAEGLDAEASSETSPKEDSFDADAPLDAELDAPEAPPSGSTVEVPTAEAAVESLDFEAELEAPIYTDHLSGEPEAMEIAEKSAGLEELATEPEASPQAPDLDLGDGLDFGSFDAPTSNEEATPEAVEASPEDALDLEDAPSLEAPAAPEPVEEAPEAALEVDDSPQPMSLGGGLDDELVEPAGLDEAIAGTAATVNAVENPGPDLDMAVDDVDALDLEELGTVDSMAMPAEAEAEAGPGELDLEDDTGLDLDFEEPEPVALPEEIAEEPALPSAVAAAPAWSGLGPCPRCKQTQPRTRALRLRCPHCDGLFFVKGGQLSHEAETNVGCPSCRSEFTVPVSIWCDTCRRSVKPFSVMEQELRSANGGGAAREGAGRAVAGGKRGFFGRK